jgi:hypothetical protein
VIHGERVFGIGLNKTGTTSLKQCFRILGFEPVAPASGESSALKAAKAALWEREDYEPALRFAENFRSFEDRPWNMWQMHRHADLRFPGSKFVLTVREPESWWRSVQQWTSVAKPGMVSTYRDHLRIARLEREAAIAAFHAYNDEVRRYFAGRDQDFLVIDFSAGQGWPELCRFLGKPVPDLPFPRSNTQAYDPSDRERVKTSKKAKRKKRRDRARLAAGSGEKCSTCGHPVAFQTPTPTNLRRRLPRPLRRAFNNLQLLRIRRAAQQRGPVGARLDRLRAEHPGLGLDDFAVVCAYFNPLGLRSRRENFRRFHAGLAQADVPLLVVELAFGDAAHQLDEASDALRVRSRDVLWHKERLLNLGIAELLRRGYRKIAWLDADIAFDEPEHWPWFVAAELERSTLCQVFEHARALQTNGSSVPGISAVSYLGRVGEAALQLASGPTTRHPLGLPLGLSGYGWAARAELLREALLYDSAVIGGGDKMIFLAAAKRNGDHWRNTLEATVRAPFQRCQYCGTLPRSLVFEEHYKAWAQSWNHAIHGRLSCAPVDLRTFFHGDWNRRSYLVRREILLRHAFDPAADVAPNGDGCWEWSSDKPELHREVRDYFAGRAEDEPEPART